VGIASLIPKAAWDSRGRYTVRFYIFYIVAITFAIFDVETIFLFPWGALTSVDMFEPMRY
jgi:NADH:ubiquinone oxidoreductase subunit 3 (subunit A)